MLDYVITGGTIVDGTGSSPRRGDIGVRDGLIVAVGEVDEPAREKIDADFEPKLLHTVRGVGYVLKEPA